LLAKETGGFVIRNTNDFGVDRVLEDQNGYYLIGYRPATETFQRQLHKIQVRVKAGGFTVRTRAGFYGTTENATAGPPTERDRMNNALLSPFGATDIAVRLKAFFADDPVRGSLLRNFVVVDTKNLTFYTEANGMPTTRYEVSYLLFSDNGAVVDRQDQTITMQLSQEVFERAQREGMVISFDLPLKRTGSLQLRVALRDVRSERIGSASQFVQTPNLSDGRLALSNVLLYAEGPGIEPDDWNRALVLRRFQHGASLVYGYTIYNAALDKKTQRPQLTTHTEIFRDSVKIYSSDRTAVTAGEQTDLKRINAGARLQLGPALTPGEYVVQIVVEDQVAKRTAVQVTQFEVK
jgi:hypothetical protein